ncbi:MAG: ATP-binding cassette domain-containing protein, partial [Candidatus Nanopelagicales bacterium]
MTGVVPALEVVDLHRGFGGVPVLKGVSLSIPSGHVTALVGENGAGKSTLMKIVTGQIRAESGSVRIGGQEIEQGDPGIAHRSGVSIVPQELAPYTNMTVYENLFVGREIRSRSGLLNRAEMKRQARALLAVVGVDVNPDLQVSRLPVAVIQLLEIAKATSYGAKVILLDEPTSSIAEREVERLYGVIKQLRSSG